MIDFRNAKKYILERLETELKPNLYYHGIHHTMDVYEASIKIAELEGLSQDDKIIVNTAALYHDSGFIYCYEENEYKAVELVNEVLPDFGYKENQVKFISDIIVNTRMRAKPITLLQEIMSDADYDYLGRDDVGGIADTLHQEINEYRSPLTKDEWNEMQIKFLFKHSYYTRSSLRLRRPKKVEYYNYLKSLK